MDVAQEKRLQDRGGLVRDLKPGPLAPNARIITLDHRATGLCSTEADVSRILLCSMLQSLRHSAPAEVQNWAQATGQISEKLDFAVPALAWPCFRSIFLNKHQEQNTLSELNGHIMPLPHTHAVFA